MTVLPPPQCESCLHLLSGAPGPTCAAFPEGIPARVWSNVADHRQPIEGDRDIQFEQSPDVDPFPFGFVFQGTE